MAQSGIPSIPLIELIGAALSRPAVSIVVALAIATVVLLVPWPRAGVRRRSALGAPVDTAPDPAVTRRYTPELRMLEVGALAVLLAFVVEHVLRVYVFSMASIVEWWQYATPVFAGALVLGILLALIAHRGTARPEQPVVASRRTWVSFSSRAGLIGATAAVALLVATTIAAGAASSPDERGRFIYLAIPVPNTRVDPLRFWFYGWAYGIPVLICLAALVVVAWATLRSNALRPFIRPDTVGAETAARTRIATAVATIATASVLLALAGAWRTIGRAASPTTVAVANEGPYDMVWRYAEFAAAAGWLAPIVEIAALAMLLIVGGRMLGMRARAIRRAPFVQVAS